MIKKTLKWTTIMLLVLIVVVLSWLYINYGGKGEPFPSMATQTLWPNDSLKIVATLPEPPGNLAVSKKGRIFCTYHAEGRPETKVWELVDGKPQPFPNEQWQSDKNGDVFLGDIFNIRIDAKDRLWTVDHGFHGIKTPRLLCFDINTRELVEQIDLLKNVCGTGSYIQDMQIDSACAKIYIADLAAFGKNPAIVVVDVATKKARRLLENHESVLPGDFKVVNKGRTMAPIGPFFHFHPAVDPIALDKQNVWLYYGPMSGDTMYRIRASDLNNESLSAKELGKRVEFYAKKSQCDGITMDRAGNIYLTSIEDGAINVIGTDRKQYTLVTHEKMRWPDGMSFGPDGYVYVADSDIPDMMMKSKSHMKENAPYYIFKFKGLANGVAGQ
jgi:Major royal jelly protein